MTDLEPATGEELQEALSHRYVDAARAVLLASGRFAVFSMAGGEIIACVGPEGLASAVAEACRISGESWTRSRENRDREPTVQVSGTAQELGL